MARKRQEYFQAGVNVVWEVDVDRQTVTVFTSPESSATLDTVPILTEEKVLPGLEIPVANIFAELDRKRA